MSVSYVHDQPQLVWLVIPGKASWLKEFFSVQMMVTNLADPDFTLEQRVRHPRRPRRVDAGAHRRAAVTDRDSEPIPGGQSRTATWVLRGDTEGFYDLTASYAGTLEPFGDTVTMQAATEKQLHVWGGSALELVGRRRRRRQRRYPYHVTVGLKNVADVPVYNPTIELLKEGKKNYIYQPREQLVVAAPASWRRATPSSATTSWSPRSAAPWTSAGRSSARPPAMSSYLPLLPAIRPAPPQPPHRSSR